MCLSHINVSLWLVQVWHFGPTMYLSLTPFRRMKHCSALPWLLTARSSLPLSVLAPYCSAVRCQASVTSRPVTRYSSPCLKNHWYKPLWHFGWSNGTFVFCRETYGHLWKSERSWSRFGVFLLPPLLGSANPPAGWCRLEGWGVSGMIFPPKSDYFVILLPLLHVKPS